MAQDFPAQYGNSDMYRNPNGTLPMPSPNDIPRPRWDGGKVGVRWNFVRNVTVDDPDFPTMTGFLYDFTWTTPAFDLRPDLRSSQGGPKAGVPMWSSAARLYVQLQSVAPGSGFSPPPPLSLSNCTVAATDFTSVVWNYSDTQGRIPSTPGQVATPNQAGAGLESSSLTNVSSLFNAGIGQTAVLAGFAPPGSSLGGGDGYPVRYWRLQLSFSILVAVPMPLPPVPVQPQAVLLQASMY